MYQDNEDNPGALDVTIQFERVSDREIRAWAILDMTAKVRLDLPFDLPREMPPTYALRMEPEEDARLQAEQFKQYLHNTLQASLETAIEDVLGVQIDLEATPPPEMEPAPAELDLEPAVPMESYTVEQVAAEPGSGEPMWFEDETYDEESES